MKELDPALTAEIKVATHGAQLFGDGPAVHYGKTPDAYAVNVTVLYNRNPNVSHPHQDVEVLIVQRDSGDGVHGSWSGVSGFIDRPDVDDPLRHAIFRELHEEVGISEDEEGGFVVHVGKRFTEPRKNGGTLHVVPVVVATSRRPDVRPDGAEVSDYRWVPLGRVATLGAELTFSPGYLERTLPGALAVFGATPESNEKAALGVAGQGESTYFLAALQAVLQTLQADDSERPK